MKRSKMSLVLAVAIGWPMVGCDPVAGDDGMGGAVTNPIGGCEVDGRDVMLVVETSRRMSLGSGYSQGSKEISRFEMVKDTLKHSLPHLKKAIDFGLILFPFEGEQDKKGVPRVCPTSCAIGDTLIQPGAPYGWMVSSLEHAAEGGRAAVGSALASARAYFEGRPAAGRVRSVMLFAAGSEECGADAVAEAAALRAMGVAVYVFTFASVDDPRLTEIAMAGGGAAPTDDAVWTLAPGSSKDLLAALEASSIEVCDGTDNDCDGETDEELNRACPCGSGVQECRDGDWGPCLSPADLAAGLRDAGDELCDGLDNDCDGDVDEGFGLGLACSTATGACQAIGEVVCSPSRLGATCSAPPPVAAPESCDGIDNDCDGSVDEDVTVECADACGTGRQWCSGGVLGACVIEAPAAELCDGQDNDCDGYVDEGFDVGATCTAGSGQCGGQGVMVCSADGLSTECSAEGTTAAVETCNGVDDDCDGKVDEGTDLCPDDMVCYAGECVWD